MRRRLPAPTTGRTFALTAGCLLAAAGLWCCLQAGPARASARPASARARNSTRVQKQQTECGTTADLAHTVSVCAKPLMDLLQGTIEKWPQNADDALELCDSFGVSERCIKDASRRCAKGVQKTIVSTLALSIARARKRECSRAQAPAIVKTTQCISQHQATIHEWMGNVTGRLTAIETQTPDPDKKVNSACCMVNQIEAEIKIILEPLCPDEARMVVRLYRTVLEDVLDIICRAPKCNNFMRGYKVPKSRDFDGIIEILLRVVFSLDQS